MKTLGLATGTCNCFYGFGVGAAATEAKRNAGIEKTTLLRILPDASWHAARDHPLHADQFSLLARREPTKLSEQRSHFVGPALCHPKKLRLFVFYVSMASRGGKSRL